MPTPERLYAVPLISRPPKRPARKARGGGPGRTIRYVLGHGDLLVCGTSRTCSGAGGGQS